MGNKGFSWPSSSYFACFPQEKVSTTLQKTHATSILKHIIIIGEGSSKLTIFLGFASLFLSDMLLVIGWGFGT